MAPELGESYSGLPTTLWGVGWDGSCASLAPNQLRGGWQGGGGSIGRYRMLHGYASLPWTVWHPAVHGMVILAFHSLSAMQPAYTTIGLSKSRLPFLRGRQGAVGNLVGKGRGEGSKGR